MNANKSESQAWERGKREHASAAALLPEPMFARVTIVGVGMMGGSVGLALRARGIAQTVIGIDLNAAGLARAREIGAIDEGATELGAGVAAADVVILAAPVGAIPSLLQSLIPFVRPDALITDIGSAKRQIVEAGERCFGERFVGGHPMAGSPQGGIDAALPNLFEGAAWAIVRSRLPNAQEEGIRQNDPFAATLYNLARALGARPVLLDSARHDRLVALVSHLPHVLSFAFADMMAASTDSEAASRIAGSSYGDMMRVSTSDRAFWQDIFTANRAELLTALELYEAQLQALRQTLKDA